MKQKFVLSLFLGLVATVLGFAHPSTKIPIVEYVEKAAFWTAFNIAARIGGGYEVLFVYWFLLEALLFSSITLLIWNFVTALRRKF